MTLLKSNQQLERGYAAPDFRLQNAVTDDFVSLSDFNGPVVILFMCNHCPYVMKDFEEIQELAKQDIPIIAINPNNHPDYPDDGYDKMKSIAEQLGLTYYLFDETQDIAKEYGAVCTPDPFVFDKEHKLVYHGRLTDALNPDENPTKFVMRDVLKKVQNEEEIEEWFLPSQGCSIKWQ